MNATKDNHVGIVGYFLIIPAATLVSSGILYSVFGLESANRFIDGVMAIPGIGWLFSPLIILGGPVIAFVLNTYRICRLELNVADRTATLSLSIKGIIVNLIPAATSAALTFMILLYGFVENFQIVMK